MTTTTLLADAEQTYDALADAYDVLTADYPYDRWLRAIETLAVQHGLSGRRLLDVACGTGKSFLPLLRRGYAVTGCDLSQRMLAKARIKAPGARLVHADMRDLPDLGRHDLVTCLDDSLNYLLSADELRAALNGIVRSLAVDGVAAWDLNTVAMYRESFTGAWIAEGDGMFVAWNGETPSDVREGGMATANVEVFRHEVGGSWSRTSSRHRQRHWPVRAVVELAADAGLRVLKVHGQRRGARIERELHELVHVKAMYVACRDDRRTGEEVPAMRVGSP